MEETAKLVPTEPAPRFHDRSISVGFKLWRLACKVAMVRGVLEHHGTVGWRLFGKIAEPIACIAFCEQATAATARV